MAVPVGGPVHTWQDIQAAFIAPATSMSVASLNHWREAFEDKVPQGALAIETLQQETQLTLDEKVQILDAAVAAYEGAKRGPWPRDAPFMALRAACRDHIGRGEDVSAHVEDGEELARVMSYEVAQTYLFTRLGGPATRLGNAAHSYVGARWEPATKLADVPFSRTGLFLTPATYVDSLPSTDLGGELRDHLGSPHLDQRPLLEIRIDASVVKAQGPLHRPTIADAGAFPPFMASENGSRYGSCRNLRTPARPGSPGAPELWHANLTANRASRIRQIPPAGSSLTPEWKELPTYNEA
jgi:hypothetical protein